MIDPSPDASPDASPALDLLRAALTATDPRAAIEALIAPEHARELATLPPDLRAEADSTMLRLEGLRGGCRSAVVRLRKAIGLAAPRTSYDGDADDADAGDAAPLHERVAAGRLALRDLMTHRVRHDPAAALFAVDGRTSRLRTSGDAVVVCDAGPATLAVALSEAMPWPPGAHGVSGPPTAVTAAIFEAPDGALPVLDRVAHGPCLDREGRLVATRGYHGSLRAYLDIPEALRVTDAPPAPATVSAALDLIYQWIGGFPFETDGDRANFVALNVSVMCREMYKGPTPMFMVSAPSRGAGKTLLASLAQDLHQGARVVRTWPRRDEEDRAILATLRPRHPIVLFDNVDDAVDSPSLAALTTAETWSGRLLGQSAELTIPVRSVIVLTGRTPATTDELARRTRVIHLVPQVSKPWLRDGWEIPDITGWTHARRGDLLSALLVMVRDWQAAGKPPPPRLLGSYEDWSRVVGGIVSRLWPGWDEEPPERADLRVQDLATTVISWWANRCRRDAVFPSTLTTSELVQRIRDEEAGAIVDGVKVVSLGRMLTSRHGCTVDIDGSPWR
ncbi:MAG: hypothetical protein ACO3JT_09340, partial [Candidatus Nanopelagicales bacterium]